MEDNWTLDDELKKTEITWYSYEPTRIEIREKPLSISVTYIGGSGETKCQAVSQIKDQHKIDIYLSLRNLEGNKERLTAESKRMLIKDHIMQIIHDNQLLLTGVKFSKYIRSARSDEVDSEIPQWYLHETLFCQAEWFHVIT